MSVGARCEVERLSQKAMSPSFHLKRTVYSGRVTCSHSISRIVWLSRGVSPTTVFREGWADEQNTLPGLGMDGHQRMLTLQCAALDAFVVHAAWFGALARHEFMNTAQPVDEPAHRRRQSVIGGDKIGPECVPAIRWYRHAAQDRGTRRVDRGRDVGVPAGPGCHHHRGAIFVGGPVLGDRVDFRKALDMAEHRVADGRLAELARHGHMPRVIEMLPAKEDDLPFQKSVPR